MAPADVMKPNHAGADGPARRRAREAPGPVGMHSSDTALLAFSDVRVPDEVMLDVIGRSYGL